MLRAMRAASDQAERPDGRPAAWAGRALPLALVVAVAAVAYRASLDVPFQFDDVPNIVDDPSLHLTRLDGASLSRAVRGVRPLARLSFALNHLAGGLDVRGFHAVNLAFHAANGLLVRALALEVLALALPALALARRRRAALVAALVFVAHPVQTQAVTYVVQRMASMGAFFALAATLLWVRARTRPRGRPVAYAGAALAAFLAFASKESYVALPGVVLAVDALLLGGWRERLVRHRVAAAISVVAAAAGAARLWAAYRETIASEAARFGYTIGERLLTEPRVVWHYASLLALPLPGRLQLDYDWPLSRSLVDPPSTLVAIAAMAALVAVAWRTRRRWPLLAFAVLWFLGNLAVESSVLPIDLVFEHRVYFPAFGPILAACAALEVAAGAVAWRTWAAAAPAVALLAVATDVRNRQWRDPAGLQRAAFAPGAETTRALLTIGADQERRGDLAGAEATFRRALEKDPRETKAMDDLAVVARRRGELAAAEGWYRRALGVQPALVEPHYGLAEVFVEAGRLDDARAELDLLLRLAPGHVDGWIMSGDLAFRAGDAALARERFTRAIELDPANVTALKDRAIAGLSEGRVEDGLRDLRAALARSPADAEALRLLGDALSRVGRGGEAEAAYRDAIRRVPAQRGLRFDLASLLAAEGRLEDAERELLGEVALAPHAGAYNNLGNVYLERDPARAREMYRRALALDPGNATAAANLRALGPR